MKNNDKRRTPLRLIWSERIRRSTPAWQEKLKRIKEQLWQGIYSVKSEDVAKAMLRKEKSLFGTK
jgi:anti-sigma28 factor (negative regulator of flagellin synthesis)